MQHRLGIEPWYKEVQGPSSKEDLAMAVSVPRAPALTDLELMAHLYRRAGFGATHDELQTALGLGYEAAVEALLHPEAQPALDEYLINRYYVDVQEGRQINSAQYGWIYRMINTRRPLEEKMSPPAL
jgi:hypothetical protein